MKAHNRRSAGRRTTIYRLTGVQHMRDALRSQYLDRSGFKLDDATVGGRPALLLTGAMTKESADWCATLMALTGKDPALGGATPAGVLLIRPAIEAASDSEVAYALTYGMGFQLLELSRIDSLFGQRIAIRTAEPDKLRSLTVTTMDERSRISRATIPQGDGLLGFGVGDIGEAVSRVVAMANLPGLSRSDGKPIQVRGADALNVPIGRTPDEVVADLDTLERLLATPAPPALEVLEQLTAVKNPETKKALDRRLSAVLAGADGMIGLAWPHERVDENGTPDSWIPQNLWPRGGTRVRQGQPDWDEIQAALDTYPGGRRLDRVNGATIQLFRDAEGQEPISQAIPLRRWLAFQTQWNDRQYALYDGAWFQIHHDYADKINRRTQELFAKRVDDVDFPHWSAADDEAAYNVKLAEATGGVCLDRELITTELHRRGIEPCDVYLPDGSLIHVKRTEKSSAASHLLAQALVSADALCNDEGARMALRKRIATSGGDSDKLRAKPARVILAVHRKDGPDLTAENLFTFTKVSLVRQAASLEARGVAVRVISIGRAS